MTPEQARRIGRKLETVAAILAALKTSADDAIRELVNIGAAVSEQQPAQCTCEYPYPREIWDGHHPDCAVLNRAEDGTDV